jgi:hypothetical protein
MRIHPRSFWTQNELGAAEVGIILGHRDTLPIDDPWIPREGCDALSSLLPIVVRLDIEIHLNRPLYGLRAKRGEELKLIVRKSKRDGCHARVTDGRIDCEDVIDVFPKPQKGLFCEGPITIVNDQVEPFHREKGKCLEERVDVISVEEDPRSVWSLGIGKPSPIRIPRVVHPIAAVCKALSRDH